MVFTVNTCKIFLIVSNIILLVVGLTILILGVKMYIALSMLLLTSIPFVMKAVKAVMATGTFISLSGLMGFCGVSCESKRLLMGHLISLGIIVTMEFSLGVTLMMVNQTVSAVVDSSECNNVCAATIDKAILDYALPSAGLMMTIIFVEALMIYCSIRLYFFMRDRQKESGPSTDIQTVQMQNVADPQPPYVTTPQNWYTSQPEHSPHQPQLNYAHQIAETVHSPQAVPEDKPPDYNSLLQPLHRDDQMTPGAIGGTSAAVEPKEETNQNFNQV